MLSLGALALAAWSIFTTQQSLTRQQSILWNQAILLIVRQLTQQDPVAARHVAHNLTMNGLRNADENSLRREVDREFARQEAARIMAEAFDGGSNGRQAQQPKPNSRHTVLSGFMPTEQVDDQPENQKQE